MAIEIKSAIICDQIRTEDNGKKLLIGVYTGSILFEQFPAIFGPSLFIEFTPFSQNGVMEFEMKVEAPTGKKAKAHPGSLPIQEQKQVALAISVQPMEIQGPGVLRFLLRPKGGRWTEVLAKRVDLKSQVLQDAELNPPT